METRRRRFDASVKLRKVVIITSVLSSVYNTLILILSAPAGRWVLGDALCQVSALISQALVAGSVWMIAIAALERCYHILIPTEHAATFSDVNINIIINGVYLFLLVLHTGPLYGWGEYSSLRGGLYVYVSMMPAMNTSFQATNIAVLTDTGNQSCTAEAAMTKLIFDPKNITDVLHFFLETEYGSDTRSLVRNSLLIILRFESRTLVDTFYRDFTSGDMTRKLSNLMQLYFTGCNFTVPDTVFDFQLATDVYHHYIDVHIPFQELGICSLDFSTVNSSITSWIPFVVSTSTGIPYGVIFLCGVILLRASFKSNRITKPTKAETFLIGSVVGLLTSVPFYYVNIANHRGVYVSYTFNLIATLLYFFNSVFFVIISGLTTCCFPTVIDDTGDKRQHELSTRTEEPSTSTYEFNSGRGFKELHHSV